MAKKKSILDLIKMKKEGEQVAWITAYDFPTAMFAEQAGMDMILVGDSLGMVILGYNGTIPVTMEDCISHCQAVRRGAPKTWIIGDMPFGSYQSSDAQAVDSAVRFMKEADVDCVKLEGGVRVQTRIRAIADAGIPVIGHIGLTPQSSGQLGGFKAQGRDVKNARGVIEDALAVEAAGAFAILVEAVPPELTAFIAKNSPSPFTPSAQVHVTASC
jgi:3-methyl-2-oxobutanoate hydroxymethyltransferase